MTTPTQFQQAGAFSTYYNIGADGLYVGTDVDNSNANGTLCVLPFYKRGYGVVRNNAVTQVFRIPGNSQVVDLKLENSINTLIPNCSIVLTGRNATGATSRLLYNLNFSYEFRSSFFVSFTSDALSAAGGDYCIPDVGLTYSTVTLTIGFPPSVNIPYFLFPEGTQLPFTIGFIPAAVNTTPGQ